VNAAGRQDGKVLPVPEGMTLKSGALTSTLNALEKRGLIVPLRKGSRAAVLITAKGRDAAGLAVSGNTHTAKTDPAKRSTKAARIISLLTRPDGVTVPEIMREADMLAEIL
jgi:DNA-binding PadR family transcriptional regulator